MLTNPVKEHLKKRLATLYGDKWTIELHNLLMDEFAHLTDDIFVEMLRRHVHDPELGVYPPKPADIERHLHEMSVEAERQQREQENSRRLVESRCQPVGKNILEKLGWQGKTTTYAAQRKTFITAIRRRFNMHWDRGEDREVLYAMGQYWMAHDPPPSTAACLVEAERWMAEQRPSKPTRG
jgi:hypothetical protein